MAPVILILGKAGELQTHVCKQLAARTGGTSLVMASLIAAEMDRETEDGAALRALVEAHKIVPARVQLQLMLSAISKGQPPFVVSGFPRTAGQLNKLLQSGCSLACTCHLAAEEDGASATLARHISAGSGTGAASSSQVFEISETEHAAAAAAAEEALRGLSVPLLQATSVTAPKAPPSNRPTKPTNPQQKQPHPKAKPTPIWHN